MAHGSDAHPLVLANIKKEPPDSKEAGWLEGGRTSDSDSDSEIPESRHSSSSKRRDDRVRCAWCGKPGQPGDFSLRTPGGGKAFCSEQCFTLCRRASFKRNKTCDWCRHVRHTVSYVDFQDGQHQLQFCSDKCLNQYKMNLFCKETEAQLEAHPHLRESTGEQGLITPELWLRDCRSPGSESSSSPPQNVTKKQDEVRKEGKKKSRSRPRRAPSPPRVPLFPPPPLPPWRRKPEMPGLVPLRPLPLLLPPPTTLVPFPFFLPIPIPIPIPIPLPGIKFSDLLPNNDLKPSDSPQPHKRKRLPDEPDPLRKHESVHA